MRRRWPAKQRLWLGPDRHRGSCGHTVANSEPESYAHSNSYAFGMRTDGIADCNGDSDCYCYSYSDGDSYSFGHADSDAYFNAQTCAYAALSAVTEASADSRAKTISPR
jgi:hypothetical protein